jgi:hypothetical protein
MDRGLFHRSVIFSFAVNFRASSRASPLPQSLWPTDNPVGAGLPAKASSLTPENYLPSEIFGAQVSHSSSNLSNNAKVCSGRAGLPMRSPSGVAKATPP